MLGYMNVGVCLCGMRGKIPVERSKGAAAPRGQNEPSLHGRQVVAPVSFWYVPPSQSAHSSAPGLGAMLPGRHK